MLKPTTIPEDIRTLQPKRTKIYLTKEAADAAKTYPNQPIALADEAYVDKSYAGTIAWQAELLDPKFRIYWSFREEGINRAAGNGKESYYYKGPAFISFGEVEGNKPVKPVMPMPTGKQLVSVLNLDERRKLIGKMNRSEDTEGSDQGSTAKELIELMSPVQKKKLAARYWDTRRSTAVEPESTSQATTALEHA